MDTTRSREARSKYYTFGGKRVAMRKGPAGQASTLTYLHGDHLGSTSLATYGSGAQMGQEVPGSRATYYPYGEMRTGNPTALPTDYQYTGQRHEMGFGLYDYVARYYDPLLGRFISADTVVPDPGNPQDLNRYAYTQNNPVRYTDPSGHYVYEQTPNDPWVFSTAAVRSEYWYTHPECEYRTISDAEAFTAVTSPIWVPLAAATGIEVVGVVFEGIATIVGGGGAATTATTAACADGDCTNEATSAGNAVQRGLEAIRNGVGRGFDSFRSFKYHMGGSGEGKAWHHIVGQLKSNVERFGEQAIHNTNNLIRLPDRVGEIHRQVTGFYNSIQPQITGSDTMRVYEWVATKSFEFQWKFGMDVILQFGGEQHVVEQFGG